jgi:hypothetical protein
MSNSNNNANGQQSDSNRPATTIRYGAIKATIWRNETRNGSMYSTTVTRTYKEGDDWRESHSFGPGDLPTVAKVMLDAHTWVQEQMVRERQEERQPQQPRKGREPAHA